MLRVVVDGLNGVGGAPFAALCARLGYVVHSVGTEPVEDFGGMKPDPTIVESQVRCADLVRTLGADLGFILDGDGDRLIVLDHEGLPVQSQELLAILLHFAPPELASRLSGPIFVTTTCGEMVRRVGELRGTPVTETGVGFKHVAPLLWAATRSCGVGSVGDLGFRDLAADRDPMAVAIVLAMVLGHTGANLRALHRQLQAQLGLAHLHWDERHFPASEKGDDLESCARLHATAEGWLESVPELTVDGVRMRGPAGQWLMVRKSTTESGYRLYGEFHAGAGPVNSA
ncbi:MAG: hypothetical protein ACREPQ_13840 [Rhodanobacter sp.]